MQSGFAHLSLIAIFGHSEETDEVLNPSHVSHARIRVELEGVVGDCRNVGMSDPVSRTLEAVEQLTMQADSWT